MTRPELGLVLPRPSIAFSFVAAATATLLVPQVGAAAPLAEVHVQICDAEVAEFLEAMGLDGDAGEARRVHYFDTSELSIYAADAIIRAVRIADKKVHVDVKLRPADIAGLTARWGHLDGWKCEYDSYTGRRVPACRLRHEASEKTLDAVLRGDAAAATLLTTEQRALLRRERGIDIAALSLESYGPGRVERYEREDLGGVEDVTIETWEVEGRPSLLELSTRVPLPDDAETRRAVKRLLEARGLSACPTERPKIESFLE